MTDISALEAYAGQLSEAASRSNAASVKQHGYIHGDDQADVDTENGPVPSIAKQARLSREKTSTLEADLADPSQGGGKVWCRHTRVASAVARSVNDRLSDHINLLDKLSPAQRANVESGAGTLDCTDAWDALLMDLKYPGPFVYPVTPKVSLPMGAIYFASEKVIEQRIHIVGHGGGQSGGDYGTTIKFPADCSGLIFKKANTGPSENGSDGSILEGVFVQGGGINAGARTKHGIDMQARIQLRNSTVNGFSGSGVNIVADVANRKNANLWVLDVVKLRGNGVHGLYVQGGDSNAGIATMVDASNNNRCGINDESFLGNTYLSCHTSANGKQGQVHYAGNRYYCKSNTLGGSTTPGTNSAVWGLVGAGAVHPVYPDWVSGGEYYIGFSYRSTGSNARNVFLGCYAEGAQPPAHILKPAVVIGGILGAGPLTPESTALVLSDNRISDFENTNNSSLYTFSIGLKGTNTVLGLFAVGDHSNGLCQQWDPTLGAWVWKHANSTQLSYMTAANTTITAGRPSPIGGGVMGIPRPIVLGSGSGQRMFGKATWTGAVNPPSGVFAQGDTYIFAGASTIGGKVGISCTTGGDAGVTAVFGKWGEIVA
ncbi:hypothetical protein [Pseudomonas fluorescens]|uniref:Uncharacterized protein n=1 Tax=Pseudomonas fluorescens TaxID=294 RepID=A0A5E7RV68_PSEFL|nr:hypothetical protein [Pseudomonas fluorescens]VVP78392.1 hypothetical protein PS928_00476 [Pseudomonas fluorescens]